MAVQATVKQKRLTLTLNNFVVPLDDILNDVMRAITHWSQWIDCWAVGFSYSNDTFHNEWQSYRTKQNPKVELTVSHEYPESRRYSVMVMVIDILGNNATKFLEVKV